MEESLNLFEEICNLRWFTKTSMILFLNKKDLFEQKIQQIPLSVCFEDYDYPGPADGSDLDELIEHAENFIRTKFEERNRTEKKKGNKLVYSHITNATDTGNVSVVFNTCQDIIIRESLKQAGLLMN